MDWLSALGIGPKAITVSAPVGGAGGQATGSGQQETPKQEEAPRTDFEDDPNGKTSGSTSSVVAAYPGAVQDATKPTLITPEYAAELGLGNDYHFGVVYNGKAYRPTDQLPFELGQIMDNVTNLNRTVPTQAERYAKINEVLNIPGIDTYAQ